MPKIKRGYAGGYYLVFESECYASDWEWFMWGILRRPRACFGQYDNAYRLFGA